MIARATSRHAAAAMLALAAACGSARPGETTASTAPGGSGDGAPRLAVTALPSLERWQHHITDEVLPFWTMPEALGQPIGNFPTFRCNDGTLPMRDRAKPDGPDTRQGVRGGGSAKRADPRNTMRAAPCKELAPPPRWMAADVDKDYARMKSRQTFLYGVAFHVTGDERYLEYARAGVAWLREHAYERDTAVSYWIDGRPGPASDQRTAQDLAYAQVGLAFYYYLTRDPDVLADLVRLERAILARYWWPSPEPPGGMLRWQLADGDVPGASGRQELVSQLDQINAYMLLLAPLIEDPQIARDWRRDLVLLAKVVEQRFFAPEHGMFWGTLESPESRRLGSRHTDFGHSMKSLWMLYLTGEATGDRELVEFAQPKIAPLLARAAQPSGCWGSGLAPSGELDRGSQWWIFAELDQAAATMAGRAPSPDPYAGYLAASYACWFERFVDRAHGDVWPGIPPDWTPGSTERDPPLKQHLWKNGYHVMEHALVALITTAGLTGQRLALYYAFAAPPPRDRIRPYLFTGRIADERDHPLPGHPALHGRRVEFAGLR